MRARDRGADIAALQGNGPPAERAKQLLVDVLAWARHERIDIDALLTEARAELDIIEWDESIDEAGWGYNPEPQLGDPEIWAKYRRMSA